MILVTIRISGRISGRMKFPQIQPISLKLARYIYNVDLKYWWKFEPGAAEQGGQGGQLPPLRKFWGGSAPPRICLVEILGENHFHFFTNFLKIFLHSRTLNIHSIKKKAIRIMNSEKGQFVHINISFNRSWRKLNFKFSEVITWNFALDIDRCIKF